MTIIPCTRDRFSTFVKHHVSLHITRISDHGCDLYTVHTTDVVGNRYVLSCEKKAEPLRFADAINLARFLRTCGVSEIALPIAQEIAETVLAATAHELRRAG